MSINYQEKYLKYKMKYLAMKELIGGDQARKKEAITKLQQTPEEISKYKATLKAAKDTVKKTR